MEWSRQQTGERKAPWEERFGLGPAAAAASSDGDHPTHRWHRYAPSPTSPAPSPSDSDEFWRRRAVVLAQAQALGEAFAFALNSISTSVRDKKPTTPATELWSPRGLDCHQKKNATTNSPSTRSGRNHQPLRAAKGSTASIATTSSVANSYLVPPEPPTSPTGSTLSSMMQLNVVPSVVLHFYGFRSSLLSNITTACYRIMLDVMKKTLELAVACATIVVCTSFVMTVETAKSVAYFVVHKTFQCASSTAAVCATFLTTEAVAVVWGNKHSAIYHDDESEEPSVLVYAQPVSPPLKPAPMAIPVLPLLNLPESVAVVPDMTERDDVVQAKMLEGEIPMASPMPLASPMPMENSAHFLFPRPTGLLMATRRRILSNLREPAIVNRVTGERRRRADVVLYKSKIRVGKAFMDPVVQAAANRNSNVKPVDVYMVRVDCSTPDDKHMNPVVMWDVTATFEEFRKLEKSMRQEMKEKRLRNVVVPHLSSGGILFLQPSLTQDVLAKRRERLQKFVTELCNDAVLADCDAMRKFCQAF